jgi:hypothetical protein
MVISSGHQLKDLVAIGRRPGQSRFRHPPRAGEARFDVRTSPHGSPLYLIVNGGPADRTAATGSFTVEMSSAP